MTVDGRLLKVNGGVRTQSSLGWRPSPAGPFNHLAYDSQTKPGLRICLSVRPGSLEIRGGGEGW